MKEPSETSFKLERAKINDFIAKDGEYNGRIRPLHTVDKEIPVGTAVHGEIDGAGEASLGQGGVFALFREIHRDRHGGVDEDGNGVLRLSGELASRGHVDFDLDAVPPSRRHGRGVRKQGGEVRRHGDILLRVL